MALPGNNARRYCELALPSGWTTTVVSCGGLDPPPLLELQAARAAIASNATTGTILLTVITIFLCQITNNKILVSDL